VAGAEPLLLGLVASVIGSILLAGLLLASIYRREYSTNWQAASLGRGYLTIAVIRSGRSLASVGLAAGPVFRVPGRSHRQINFRLPAPAHLARNR